MSGAEQKSLDKEAVAEILQRHRIQPTAQRIEIANVMLSHKQHLSADQVLARVNDRAAAVSKATVYNTLGLFAERGLLRQVIVDSSKMFYDSNVEPHYHFYNVDDGTLQDVDSDLVPIEHLPSAPSGTLTDGVDIVIRIRNNS